MKNLFTKNKLLVLYTALTLTAALFMTGCADRNAPSPAGTAANVQAESTVLGEGGKEFSFTVTDKDGNVTPFEIHTDKETVGEALSELELIDGDEGEYGLYVTTVNGITADYNKDGVYWAFYINDEYAASGIDSTVITEGDSYSLRIQ